jgi:hypothetical protein
MDKKETVILRRGQVEALLSLTSLKDVKTILSAIKSYGMDGVEPEIPEHLMFGWVGIKYSIDYDNDQYRTMVEARSAAGKASAEKRKNQQVSTKSTSVEFVEQNQQVSTKSTHIHIDNDIIESEYIRACASDAERIASLYPKAKVGNFRKVVEAIINAIYRELDHPGITPEQAVSKVEAGTIKYATAVKQWPNKNKKYISDPVKFYDSGMYNHDPETWEPDESNKKQKEQNDDSSYEYVSKLR